MALNITGSITDGLGNTHENFYTRIDFYRVEKSLGHLCCNVGTYTSQESASVMFPTYQEDYAQSDASGFIPGPLTNGSFTWTPSHLRFNLTSSEVVEVITYSSSYDDHIVDYIDYDDDGNEITVQRTESLEVLHSSSQDVSKSRIDLDQITGSVYEYAYNEVKNYYINIFGAANVQDI